MEYTHVLFAGLIKSFDKLKFKNSGVDSDGGSFLRALSLAL